MDENLLRFNKEKEYVFIDCETFNLCLNSCHNLPWQIGMIKIKGNEILSMRKYYVKWKTHLKISVDAARITRFNPAILEKDGLPPEEVFPTMQDWLDNCDFIVGHNILGFDLFLIKDFYKYMGKSYKHLVEKIIDTNCLAKGLKFGVYYKQGENLLEYQYRIYNERRKGIKTNLAALGKEYEVEHDDSNLHDAIADLQLNVRIWNKMKWMIDL